MKELILLICCTLLVSWAIHNVLEAWESRQRGHSLQMVLALFTAAFNVVFSAWIMLRFYAEVYVL